MLTYYIVCNVQLFTMSYSLLLGQVAFFHYKKGLAYSMKREDPALYHAVENNTLLNDVFLHHLSQLQNMHKCMVPAQDIDGAEGDIVDVPAGEAVHSQSLKLHHVWG